MVDETEKQHRILRLREVNLPTAKCVCVWEAGDRSNSVCLYWEQSLGAKQASRTLKSLRLSLLGSLFHCDGKWKGEEDWGFPC